MNDPYLNHIQKQNQKITDQIIGNLGAPPPEVQKAMHEWKHVDVGGNFISTDGGILIPANVKPPNCGANIFDMVGEITTYSTTNWPKLITYADIVNNCKAMWDAVGDDSVKEDHLVCFGEEGFVDVPHPATIFREQRLLRAISGRCDEYVWSDVLQAHVRIGEDLKA